MAATRTYLQTNTSITNSTTYTFTAENLGTAAATRFIVVAIVAREAAGGSASVSSATIGGVSATVLNGEANGNQLALICAAVPTGTTGDIVVNWSATMNDIGIAVYRCLDLGSATATDSSFSSATPPTYAIDCDAGGIVIGVSYNRDGAASCTWAGITEDYDIGDAPGNDWSGASAEFATTQTNLTVSATWVTSSLPKMLVASFPPSVASGPANLKSLNTNVKANIKSIDTNLIANVKSLNTNV